MASLSRPAPNGHFIKGFSQSVKASSNQKSRPKIWPSEAQSAIAPRKQFINGRPQSSIEAGPDGKFIKASPQWPLYQGLEPVYQGQLQPEGPTLDLALGGPTRYCAAQAVYQRPEGRPRWPV